MTRRVLNAKMKEDNTYQQSDIIFHTHCLIQDKVCSMTIDGGSCTNVTSTIMAEKLELPTTKHPQPYKLQWLNICGDVKVKK